MSIYHFLACDFEMPILELDDNLNDGDVKSYNDLLELGYTKKQIQQQFGNILNLLNLDKNHKLFYIGNEDGLKGKNKLQVIEDFHNSFARYYSKKKYIYALTNASESHKEIINYLNKYQDRFKEIELWHVALDRYEIDDVEHKKIKLSDLNNSYLENFIDYNNYLNPKVTLIEKEKK